MINVFRAKRRRGKGKTAEESNLPKNCLSGRKGNTFTTVAGFPRCAIRYFGFLITVFSSIVIFFTNIFTKE